MFLFVLFFLAVIFLAGITTIPLAIPLLVVLTVIFRKSWIFFLALGLGIILDLFFLRPLGQTGLIFSFFIFALFLYERKFETQTTMFVLVSTFLGSLIYLNIFGYDDVLIQSLVNAIVAILLFRFFVILSKAKDLDSSSLHSSE